MPSHIQPTISATQLRLLFDADLNDSDKTFIVADGERRHVFAIYVSLTSTATVGNRQVRIDFRDPFLVNGQDETAYATFAGGTGHAASDVITLQDGSTVTVDNVTGGVVDQFTVDSTAAVRRMLAGDVLLQTSTDGSGTGFSLTVAAANIGNIFASVLAGATQAESLTYTYTFAPGLPHLTAVINTELMTPLPSTMLLGPGYSIRVYDVTAVADDADDMTVRILYDRTLASSAGSV